MAGADMILNKILDDARADATAMLTDAKERVRVIKARSQASVETSREAALKGAQIEAEQRKERRLRMAQLDARKEQLAMKRELIDEAFDFALERLLKADADTKRSLFLSMLIASAQGGEVIMPAAADQGIFTPDALAVMNGALAKDAKAPVTLGAVAPGIRGGFILSLKGMECNCSLEALLRQEREALEPEVASALFPAKEG